MIIITIILLMAALIYVLSKRLVYYGIACGLLYYIATKHNDELSESELFRIRDEALNRLMKDFANKIKRHS